MSSSSSYILIENRPSTDKQTFKRFNDLPQPSDLCLATYIWIDTIGDLRNKTRTLDFQPKCESDFPWWDAADAYSTSYINTDIFLKPVKIFNDPFYSNGKNKLVLCETYKYNKTVTDENKRPKCLETIKKAQSSKPKFIFELKYTMYDKYGINLLGEPLLISNKKTKEKNNNTTDSSSFYCSIGANNAYGRSIAESHYKACIYAGVKIKCYNSENSLAVWQYQIGPCDGVDAGDHCWIARFILQRIAEECDVVIKYNSNDSPEYLRPKVYISTAEMRENKEFKLFDKTIQKLTNLDYNQISFYKNLISKQHNLNGINCLNEMNGPNKNELNGKIFFNKQNLNNETKTTNECNGHEPTTTTSHNKNNNGCMTKNNGIIDEVNECNSENGETKLTISSLEGYLELKRPESNLDPYHIINMLMSVVVLDDNNK